MGFSFLYADMYFEWSFNSLDHTWVNTGKWLIDWLGCIVNCCCTRYSWIESSCSRIHKLYMYFSISDPIKFPQAWSTFSVTNFQLQDFTFILINMGSNTSDNEIDVPLTYTVLSLSSFVVQAKSYSTRFTDPKISSAFSFVYMHLVNLYLDTW